MRLKKYTKLLAVILFLFVALNYPKSKAEAATVCGNVGAPVAGGLVTSPKITGQFYTSSEACIVDPKAAFVPYNVPTFDSLKSLYYDQAKVKPLITKHLPIVGNATQADIELAIGKDHIYYVQNNLNVSSLIGGTQNAMVFVGGDLNIGPLTGPPSSATCTNDNFGVVFVVKGNVNIHKSVTGFNGLIIAEGRDGYSICTAYTGSECPVTNVSAQQLVIKGSLISLNDANPIKFRRDLGDNSIAAEKINHEVKYLVILRDLLSDTSLRWGEIDANTKVPPPALNASVPLPPMPPSGTPSSFCDITTCHGAYSYTSPGSCVPNDATCAATYNENTCYAGSEDCSDACTLKPESCFTGFTCAKTGVCPNNFNPPTVCPVGGCSDLTGGTQSTFYNGAQCDPATNCPITTTQPNKCPKDSEGNYTCYEGSNILYHEANSCNSLVCNHNLPGNTCFAGSADCTQTCSNTPQSCSTGTTCGKTGTCPSVYPTEDTQNLCNYCAGVTTYTSTTACGTQPCPTNYPTNTCFAGSADCTDACTNAPGSCSTGTTCGKTGTCPSNNNGNTCYTGSVDCPSNQCFEPNTKSCYADNSCSKSGFCPTNYLTPTPYSCPTDGCSASCTKDGCGSPGSYTSASSCTKDNATCPLKSTQLNWCLNSSGAYVCYEGADRYYHNENSCNSLVCPHLYPGNTCFTGSTDCPSDQCYASNLRQCFTGNACRQTGFCPANYTTPPSPPNSCPAGGCSTSCTSNGCGTQATYTSNTACRANDSLCALTSTQTSLCPSTCYDGADKYYHNANSCNSLVCPHLYPGNTCFTGSTDCPSDAGLCYGPNTRPCSTGNTCGKVGFCPSKYYTTPNSSVCSSFGGCSRGCTQASCGFPSTYWDGTSCTTPATCALVSTQTSVCPKDTSGNFTCYEGSNLYFHNANTCGSTLCNHNYPPATSCPAGGCTTLKGSIDDGTQASYYSGQSCSPTGCNITSTATNTCPKDNLGNYVCYDGADIKYHPASTCTTASCPHNYPDPTKNRNDNLLESNQCDYCSGFTNYYTGSQCGSSACPNNSPGYDAPSCRSSAGYYHNGNTCGLTYYGANCTTFCGPNSIGCYSNSILLSFGGVGGNEFTFENRYSNGNRNQTVYSGATNVAADCNDGPGSAYLLVSDINNAAASAGLNVDHGGIFYYNNQDCKGRSPVYPNAQWGTGSVWSRSRDNHP